MLLFFIYAALGVELFGKLGQSHTRHTHPHVSQKNNTRTRLHASAKSGLRFTYCSRAHSFKQIFLPESFLFFLTVTPICLPAALFYFIYLFYFLWEGCLFRGNKPFARSCLFSRCSPDKPATSKLFSVSGLATSGVWEDKRETTCWWERMLSGKCHYTSCCICRARGK